MTEYKNKNKFVQFQLWTECHKGCKFCCNKGQPLVDKAEGILYAIDHLDDPDINEYNEIGIIGGEFFNIELEDENVRKLFYQLFDKIAKMNFTTVYITTALTFNLNRYLIPFLDHLKELNILDKVLICTSYDSAYRFQSEKERQLWFDNMNELHNRYPELKLHTETILTQYFIDEVLNDKFNITEFCEKYHTTIDFMEPASGLFYKDKKECAKELPGFFPTKNSYIQFVMKVGLDTKEINLDSFLSMELRSSKLYFLYDGERIISSHRRDTDGRPKDRNGEFVHSYQMGLIDVDDNSAMLNIARELRDLNK